MFCNDLFISKINSLVWFRHNPEYLYKILD